MKPVSGKRLARILRDRGWNHVRTKGSHLQFEHPDFPGVLTIPVHGNQDIPTGTQYRIMRQAGLTDDDL